MIQRIFGLKEALRFPSAAYVYSSAVVWLVFGQAFALERIVTVMVITCQHAPVGGPS
jgi:hypothetical protein